MGRRALKWAADLGMTPAMLAAAFPPLRQHWREINRLERATQAQERAKRKARDKKRRKCRCEAYPWPHRPGGGLCHYPGPPVARWRDTQAAAIAKRVDLFSECCGKPTPQQMVNLTALETKPHRPYLQRYAGIRRQIARANGLHPIRDRALIESLMPRVLKSLVTWPPLVWRYTERQ
jgi:hypothetical protein